jgi:hypothetical protein
MPEIQIISGGQTGVDRAALDAALRYGFQCGGYCPRDYWAEDGKISTHYPLTALEDTDPAVRTRANVDLADGVCVISRVEPAGGTRLALDHARATDKPALELIDGEASPEELIARLEVWFESLPGGKINVAGPRLSEWSGGYQATRRIFDGWLRSKTLSNN